MATKQLESPTVRLQAAEAELKAAKVSAAEKGWLYANHSREEEERLGQNVINARRAVREEIRSRKPKKAPVMSQRKMLLEEREALTQLLDKEELKLDFLLEKQSNCNAERLYSPDPERAFIAKGTAATLMEEYRFIPASRKTIEDIKSRIEQIDFKLEQPIIA